MDHFPPSTSADNAEDNVVVYMGAELDAAVEEQTNEFGTVIPTVAPQHFEQTNEFTAVPTVPPQHFQPQPAARPAMASIAETQDLFFEHGSTITFSAAEREGNRFAMRCGSVLTQAIIDKAYAKAKLVLGYLDDERAFATIIDVWRGRCWKTCLYLGLPDPSKLQRVYNAMGLGVSSLGLPVWIDQNAWIKGAAIGRSVDFGHVPAEWKRDKIRTKAGGPVYIQGGSIGLHNYIKEAGSMAGFVTNTMTNTINMLTAGHGLPGAKFGDLVDSPSTVECSSSFDFIIRQTNIAIPEERQPFRAGLQKRAEEILADYVIEDVQEGGTFMMEHGTGDDGEEPKRRQVLVSGMPLGKVRMCKLIRNSAHLATNNEKLRDLGLPQFAVPQNFSSFSTMDYALVEVNAERYGGNIVDIPGRDRIRITKTKRLAPGDNLRTIGRTNGVAEGTINSYFLMSWDRNNRQTSWEIVAINSTRLPGDSGGVALLVNTLFSSDEDGEVGGMMHGLDKNMSFVSITGIDDILEDASKEMGGKFVWTVPGPLE
ncbi:hypothetical protein BJ508DRAFT_307480 [Ascobolus immersus RN42]|uniref:Uncharacterized protein n=1 Tax=Ascobolus immersus RN42 TaxID=1160509 RepID=A0A3N4I300_ASCIM|nr:hypothetical protein BJ508DRAFT_307480 [Ascobolus immersus RN42]